MGHESGHVVARHSARQMVNAMGLETILGVALGNNPSGAAQLAAGLAGKTALLAYGRSDELEADQYGARYSAAAGYDPRGIATFFQKLEKAGGSQPGWATFLSTHPSNPDRIEKVNRYIEQHHLAGAGGHDPGELNRVKERLRQLPPPPEKPSAAR
jgi:predicted Zn-dependent protease